MTVLWCYAERSRWGEHAAAAARARGWQARMFTDASAVGGGYAFMHPRQHPPDIGHDQAVAERVHQRARLIPDIGQIRVYEDKVAQAERYAAFMPETLIARSPDDALTWLQTCRYPFVSKAACGSSSRNVRLIGNRVHAEREIELAFGTGIAINRRRVQRGYLLWQRFLSGNTHDYRVIAVGRQRMLIRRANRPGTAFASGSGAFEAVVSLDEESAAVLEAANAFFAAAVAGWCGIDLVRDDTTGEWRVLETTTGWPDAFNERGVFIGHAGRIWDVLIEEIESGAFG